MSISIFFFFLPLRIFSLLTSVYIIPVDVYSVYTLCFVVFPPSFHLSRVVEDEVVKRHRDGFIALLRESRVYLRARKGWIEGERLSCTKP